jgi:hypothetical protein
VSNNFHQRSVSAIVPDHRRAVSFIVDDANQTSMHQRSLSSQQQQQQLTDSILPPALPPKLGGSGGIIFRPSEMTSTPTKSNDVSVAPPVQMSFLQQLVQVSML